MKVDQRNVLERLGQVQTADVGKVFREYLRGVSREMLAEVMAEEVRALCGPAYRPDPDVSCYRAGSAPGYAYMESRREPTSRPRVRRHMAGQASEEVELTSYRAAQDPSEAHRLLIEAMLAAGSTRKAEGWEARRWPTRDQSIAVVSTVATGWTGETRRTAASIVGNR